MTLHEYDVRDPAQLIADIAAMTELREGTAHLALVANVSTEQRVVRVDALNSHAEVVDDEAIRAELRRVVEAWNLPFERGLPRYSHVLVVIRPGLCVFGPNEAVWLHAERYANHMSSLWPMQLILVTEHGWVDFMTDHAGDTPSLAWAITATPRG